MAATFNGTTDTANYGWTAGVHDLNQFYEKGDEAWVIVSSVLVLFMIPGVGFFYSGLARRKSALQLLLLSMICVAVVSFEWFFWGYSLSFSPTGGPFIGDLTQFGLMNTIGEPLGAVPDLLFCLFQGMFAAITPALAIGAVADRGRMLPAIVFIFIWSSIVYNPIAFWSWNANGWLAKLGALDFAGGGPVHLNSGTAGLAYSLMLGKRAGYDRNHGLPYRPHNVTNVVLGTVLLWAGWFGFNGGSAAAMNLRAVMACVVTNLAASVAGLTWMLIDYRLEKKWSTIGFCSGAIAGLVAITPASGYVTPWGGFIIGVVGGAVCNFATKLKFLLNIDDSLDIFAIHGIGGATGTLLTGVFAASWIAGLDGNEYSPMGWIEHHWVQVGYQLAAITATFTYCFTVSCLLLFLINLVPGLSLRSSIEDEEVGMDECQVGEFAYDYVELTRHVADSGSVITMPMAGETVATSSSSFTTEKRGPEPAVV